MVGSWWGFVLVLLSAASLVRGDEGSCTCEYLRHDRQSFQQSEAEAALYDLMRAMSREVASRVGPHNISLDWVGEDFRRKTGWHDLRAYVDLGQDKSRCFAIPYSIEDVDECRLPRHHPMAHRCSPSSRCLNTNGTYECTCPDGMVAIPTTGLPSACIGQKSTDPCCSEAETCKAAFTCAPSFTHVCAPHATCVADDRHPSGCKCVCEPGYLGNGYPCEEGSQPTPVVDKDGNLQGNVPASGYCGCHVPRVDYCVGVRLKEHQICDSLAKTKSYRLRCEAGYVQMDDRCEDLTPPSLELRGPNPLVLEQGDNYTEFSVQVKDANREDKRGRRVSLAYSPKWDMDRVGDYEVTYTLSTNYTQPRFTSLTRQVQVVDLNECLLRPDSPKWQKWQPRCHPDADCKNTVGSYECKCVPGTVGDGRLDGNGCRDVVPPEIQLVGPRQITIRTVKPVNLAGEPYNPSGEERDYVGEVEALIKKKPWVLCEGEKGRSCFTATDKEGREVRRLDPSAVVLGRPEVVTGPGGGAQVRVRIPHDVTDRAGNRAVTQYREVIFEEIDPADLSKYILQPPPQQRSRQLPTDGSPSTTRPCPKCPEPRPCPPPTTCPPCPPCPPAQAVNTNRQEMSAEYMVHIKQSSGQEKAYIAFGFMLGLIVGIVWGTFCRAEANRDTRGAPQRTFEESTPMSERRLSTRLSTPGYRSPPTGGPSPLRPSRLPGSAGMSPFT